MPQPRQSDHGLLAHLEHVFPAAVRARGQGYAKPSRCKVELTAPKRVAALVRGTEIYRVELEQRRESMRVSCSCPYFCEPARVCKHVWAVLIMLERHHAAPQWYSYRPKELDLVPGDETRNPPYGAWSTVRPGNEGSVRGDKSTKAVSAGNPTKPRKSTAKSNRTLAPRPKTKATKAQAELTRWKKQIARLRTELRDDQTDNEPPLSPRTELLYVLQPEALTVNRAALRLQVLQFGQAPDGSRREPRPLRLEQWEISDLPDSRDRKVLQLLAGSSTERSFDTYRYYASSRGASLFDLKGEAGAAILELAAATNRLYSTAGGDSDERVGPLSWQGERAWDLCAVVRAHDGGYALSAELRRGEERVELSDAKGITPLGTWMRGTELHRLRDDLASAWVSTFKTRAPVVVPQADGAELVRSLFALPRTPQLDLPEELRFEEREHAPTPRLVVRRPERPNAPRPMLRASVTFEYDGILVEDGQAGRLAVDAERRIVIRRDPSREQRSELRLYELGFKTGYDARERRPQLVLAPARLAQVVSTLSSEGWKVEADGQLHRTMDRFQLAVRSAIDWFDLTGFAAFGEVTASMPELLRALRKGERTVLLGDGSIGLLPDEWLMKYAQLTRLGKASEDGVRFEARQIGLLDALLSGLSEVSIDARFAKARERLRAFDQIAPLAPPKSFRAELRGYQADALGWLHFLREFGLGGCLADDMGLGKTVVALALFDERRATRRKHGPSLIIVPSSLVFNWQSEAARFAPKLRVTAHVGIDRAPLAESAVKSDLVLTTYGTLRRDILDYKEVPFDYVVLDESQAIKNSATETAKCVRLLESRHRLALSGTPIENHLGELWSLFEFLNPGMLGEVGSFRLTAAQSRAPDDETRALLARALRPLILRRTKQQVAKELPERVEQTLSGEMGPRQRVLYEELRDHYRRALLDNLDEAALRRSKIQVLEGLLRLRQAACHPGLIDKRHRESESVKMDLLLPQLREVIEEGHKALVFSQFTSFLSIVKQALDAEGIGYEYLDGKTRDRRERVARFQNDPDAKLFLISLKAGGVGLNLTAAEYVFLLDPWWNPAVEAQAIDRAHRIGQARTVIAYRLIARGTVEEKILELQKTKRALADAIIGEDNSLIRGLKREDLELLLS